MCIKFVFTNCHGRMMSILQRTEESEYRPIFFFKPASGKKNGIPTNVF